MTVATNRPVGPSRRAALALAGIGLAAIANPAAAQIALYADRLPDGFAYVRFVNATQDPLTLRPNFTEVQNLGTDGAERVGRYQVVENVANRSMTGDITNGGATGKLTLQLKAGNFHTVVFMRNGTEITNKVITDSTEYNQLRARLAFYNATPSCAGGALALDPNNQAVFSGVEPGSMRARSVNPIASAKVRASCTGAQPVSLDLGELGEGQLYSVWLMMPAGAPISFLARDQIAPYRR